MLTLSHDGKTIEKFEIVQTCEKNCSDIFRMQKINISFYDHDHNETLFTGIIVKDQKVTEVEELEGKVVPDGFLLNSQHFGYCKVRFSQKSIDYFVQNLRHIESNLDRNLIYRYLWQNYEANKIKFSTFFELVQNNIVSEHSINAIEFVLMSIQTQLFVYMAAGEEQKSLLSKVFDLTLDLFNSRKETNDKILITNYLVRFLPKSELAFVYLTKGTVTNGAGDIQEEGFILTENQKHILLAKTFSNDSIDLAQKQKFLTEFTADGSYRGKLLEISCDAAQQSNKASWWEQFLDGTKMSKDKYVTAMCTFYSGDAHKNMTEYVDRFYDNLDSIFKNKHRDYAQAFITNLNPIALGRKGDLERMQKMYDETDPDRSHFRKYLKLAIEDLEDILSKR